MGGNAAGKHSRNHHAKTLTCSTSSSFPTKKQCLTTHKSEWSTHGQNVESSIRPHCEILQIRHLANADLILTSMFFLTLGSPDWTAECLCQQLFGSFQSSEVLGQEWPDVPPATMSGQITCVVLTGCGCQVVPGLLHESLHESASGFCAALCSRPGRRKGKKPIRLASTRNNGASVGKQLSVTRAQHLCNALQCPRV